MINFLGAFHLGWIVREVLVDCKGERKAASFVHALVWLDGESEIEDIVTIGEVNAHCQSEGEFVQIYQVVVSCIQDTENVLSIPLVLSSYLAVPVVVPQSLSSSSGPRLLLLHPSAAVVSVELIRPEHLR